MRVVLILRLLPLPHGSPRSSIAQLLKEWGCPCRQDEGLSRDVLKRLDLVSRPHTQSWQVRLVMSSSLRSGKSGRLLSRPHPCVPRTRLGNTSRRELCLIEGWFVGGIDLVCCRVFPPQAGIWVGFFEDVFADTRTALVQWTASRPALPRRAQDRCQVELNTALA